MSSFCMRLLSLVFYVFVFLFGYFLWFLLLVGLIGVIWLGSPFSTTAFSMFFSTHTNTRIKIMNHFV